MGQMAVIFTALMKLWREVDRRGYLGQSLRSL